MWNVCHKSGRVLFTTNNERTAMNRIERGWRVEKVDDLKCILNEMRSYNPKADEYGGKFIISGWADRIEKALMIELKEHPYPDTSEQCGFNRGVKSAAQTLTRAGLTVKLS